MTEIDKAIRLDADAYEKIQRAASERGVSARKFMRMLLEDWIVRREADAAPDEYRHVPTDEP